MPVSNFAVDLRGVHEAETPELIAAIHAWFDAQLSDHGVNATNGRKSVDE